MSHRDENRDPAFSAGFATTHWSLVLQAGRKPQQAADQALAALCQNYWYPLYAYVRRHVKDTSEAHDLTQEFFARLLEKALLALATPERGRFRSFLLAALKMTSWPTRGTMRTPRNAGARGPPGAPPARPPPVRPPRPGPAAAGRRPPLRAGE